MSQPASAGNDPVCPIITTPKIRQAPAAPPANDNQAGDRLRVAAEQWPHKSPEEQQHERRFIMRDLAIFEAMRADNDNEKQ